MNDTVREWLCKAELDLATARRESQAQQDVNWDAVCFHAQQCVEKVLKGLLIHVNLVPPRVHDLVYLSDLLRSVCQGWSWPIEDLRFLTHSAVSFRYPGESADQQDAAMALQLATKMRQRLWSFFGEEQ